MNEKPKEYYRVFAPGVPNVRVISERLSEADARSRKRNSNLLVQGWYKISRISPKYGHKKR